MTFFLLFIHIIFSLPFIIDISCVKLSELSSSNPQHSSSQTKSNTIDQNSSHPSFLAFNHDHFQQQPSIAPPQHSFAFTQERMIAGGIRKRIQKLTPIRPKIQQNYVGPKTSFLSKINDNGTGVRTYIIHHDQHQHYGNHNQIIQTKQPFHYAQNSVQPQIHHNKNYFVPQQQNHHFIEEPDTVLRLGRPGTSSRPTSSESSTRVKKHNYQKEVDTSLHL